jgi:hypothetical protein
MRRPGRASRGHLGLADLLGLRAAMTLAAQRADPHPVKELLGPVTYRPGWTFNVWNGILEIRATVIDAHSWAQALPLSLSEIVCVNCEARAAMGKRWTGASCAERLSEQLRIPFP